MTAQIPTALLEPNFEEFLGAVLGKLSSATDANLALPTNVFVAHHGGCKLCFSMLVAHKPSGQRWLT